MKRQQFNRIVSRTFNQCKNTLTRKGDVYGPDDRFSNFKTAARMLGCTPEKALEGFMTKHYVALHDFIATLDTSQPMLDMDEWDEKIGDMINYLLLLGGLIAERRELLIPVRNSAPAATPNSTHQPPVIGATSCHNKTTFKATLTGNPVLPGVSQEVPGSPTEEVNNEA
jgi:hypothetical protein